jgi:hypothetical protein
MKTDNYMKSVECSKNLHKLVPDDQRVLPLLGLGYYMAGDTTSSIETFEEAYRDSKDCYSYKMLIVLFNDLGRTENLKEYCQLDCLTNEDQPLNVDDSDICQKSGN